MGALRGSWIATHYTIAFPERVDRLALMCPIGIVSGLRPSWVFRALTTMSVRPTDRRVASLLDTMVMPTNRRLLRQEPWRPMMQQFASGAVGFKFSLSNARPTRRRGDCDLRRLSSARIRVLAIVAKDESLYNGPTAATRFRQQLPEARIEFVNDANHMVMVDQTEIVEKLLADFFE